MTTINFLMVEDTVWFAVTIFIRPSTSIILSGPLRYASAMHHTLVRELANTFAITVGLDLRARATRVTLTNIDIGGVDVF